MYKIEVIADFNSVTKEKGDLLESFSSLFLESLNYKVKNQIRLAACEIDLLCENNINHKTIYVECKAHRDNLSANILKNLLGTVELQEYSEGWLISTAEFGKDAKGFVEEWEKKPIEKSSKLSFYTPDKLIDSFIKTKRIISPELISFLDINIPKDRLGNWTLIISSYGNFWIRECLEGGIPTGTIVFYAENGNLVVETELLSNISKTDISLKNLDFNYYNKLNTSINEGDKEDKYFKDVVGVQQGDSWDDYRPARPQDFIGRNDEQKKIFGIFNNILIKQSETRIFAITGNSGMGKSSLINKLREKSKNKFYKNKIFLYAVDIRAAKDEKYIYSALIKCFKEAMSNNFIKEATIKITDISNPLNSESINQVLNELNKNNKIVCLVFDQFEELYSKPDLFQIFETLKNLLISVASIKSNFCLGFAWKSDSTVHQEHPAYFVWHNLKDYRLTIDLKPFSRGDSERIVNLFDKQIDNKLPKDIRHQIINHSQGFPWLLKKLCIHLYHKMKEGEHITSVHNESLDIQTLFDKDLQELSSKENAALRAIADKAPVDWFEIVENYSNDTIQSLINKRLIIKSGDRLNIYWDIFREYILTKRVSSLPFNYLPMTPSLNTFLKTVNLLNLLIPISLKDISLKINIKEKTAGNIVSDLFMFGIAKGKRNEVLLNDDINNKDITSVLMFLRSKFLSHSTTILLLNKFKDDDILKQEDIIKILKNVNPTSKHSYKTWNIYAQRISNWLTILGFIIPKDNYWIVKNSGKVNIDNDRKKRNSLNPGKGFTAFAASPENTFKLFKLFITKEKINKCELNKKADLSAINVLKRVCLIKYDINIYFINTKILTNDDIKNSFCQKILDDNVFKQVELILNEYNGKIKGRDLGEIISKKFEIRWSEGSILRVGNSLFRWYKWLNNKMDKKQYILEDNYCLFGNDILEP